MKRLEDAGPIAARLLAKTASIACGNRSCQGAQAEDDMARAQAAALAQAHWKL